MQARPGRCAATIATLAGLTLIWTRLLVLSQSLSGGEASMVEHYIGRGPGSIFGRYSPDDHLLFGLLTWLTTTVTRDFTAPAYRVWSVVPALAAVAILTWWLWRRLDRWVAVTFIVLAAAAPPFLLASVRAGGYGLALLAAAVMLIATDSLAQRRSARQLLLFTVSAIIGVWSLPWFGLSVLPAIGILMLRPGLRRDAVQAAAMIVIAGLVFYLPVIGAVGRTAGGDFGPALPWHGVVSRPLEDLVAPVFRVLAPGLSVTAATVLGGVLVTAGMLVLWRRPERMLAVTLLGPPLFGYAVVEVGRYAPSRDFLRFLELPLLVLCAVPIVAAGRWLARGRSRSGLVLGAAAVLSVLALIRADRSFQDRGTGTRWTPAFATQAPEENFSSAAALVDGAGVRSVVTSAAALAGLDHYLRAARARALAPSALRATLCSAPASFAYVESGSAAGAGLACLTQRRAISVQVPSAGVPLTVWFVTGSPPS